MGGRERLLLKVSNKTREGQRVNATETKPYTVEQLLNEIYEDNYSHLEFEWNMGGKPCECKICLTIQTIIKYRGE